MNIPPDVSRKVMALREAFDACETELERDAVAAEALHILKEHLPRSTKLRLADVKKLFFDLREQKDI